MIELHRAVSDRDLDCVKAALITTNVDSAFVGGETALHIASLIKYVDIVDLLIKVGANVKLTTDCGNTPLHHTMFDVSNKTLEIATLLVKAGATVNAKNNHNNTPLHFAAYINDVESVKILLSSDADKTAINVDGKTPADMTNSEEVKTYITNYDLSEDIKEPEFN